MNASCNSSLNNYECGCAPLEALHQIIIATPHVYGARWSGAGFGGCEIALVSSQFNATHAQSICQRYQQQFPDLEPTTFLCLSSNGAQLLRSNK